MSVVSPYLLLSTEVALISPKFGDTKLYLENKKTSPLFQIGIIVLQEPQTSQRSV